MPKSFNISVKSGVKDLRKNLKQIKQSLGKDLTPAVMEGMGAQGRLGAINGAYQDVDRPTKRSIKAIQYTRFNKATQSVTVGFNVGNRVSPKNQKITRAYSNIVFGGHEKYSRIGNRLIVPVAKKAKTPNGNLNRKWRNRIKKANGKVRKGAFVYFEPMKGGIAVFEGYRRGRGKAAYDSGRVLIAWMPDQAKWGKTYDFYGHTQRQIQRSAGAVMESEVRSYLQNKMKKIIRQGQLIR